MFSGCSGLLVFAVMTQRFAARVLVVVCLVYIACHHTNLAATLCCGADDARLASNV